MRELDAFIDTYLRPDEGTQVLVCGHRSCVRFMALLYATVFVNGIDATMITFDHENDDVGDEIRRGLEDLQHRSGVRRVVAVVCEPKGPSFVNVLEKSDNPKVDIFRINSALVANC